MKPINKHTKTNTKLSGSLQARKLGAFVILGGVTLFLIALVLQNKQLAKTKSNKQASTEPEAATVYIPQGERKEYSLGDYTLKLPETWQLVNSSNWGDLGEYVKVSTYCSPTILQDKQFPELALIIENNARTHSWENIPCWARFGLSGSYETRLIEVPNGDHKIESRQIGKPNLIMETFKFNSDYGDKGDHRLTLLAPGQYAAQVSSLFTSIVQSFEYVNKYEAKKPTEWKNFSSNKGFSFEYPANWGNVQENFEDYSELEGMSGKVYDVAFSVQSNVRKASARGIGHSADFSVGRGGFFTDYKGDVNEPAGVGSLVMTGLSLICKYTNPPGYPLLSGIITFNQPSKEISGFMLILPLLSESDLDKYMREIESFTKSEESCIDPNGTLSASVISKENALMEEILSKQNLDDESKIYVDIFNRVAASARVN